MRVIYGLTRGSLRAAQQTGACKLATLVYNNTKIYFTRVMEPKGACVFCTACTLGHSHGDLLLYFLLVTDGILSLNILLRVYTLFCDSTLSCPITNGVACWRN